MAVFKNNPWIMASRPKTLAAAIAPVLIGTAMAYSSGSANWPAAAASLFCAVMIQIGTNYCNDYFDFRKGADTEERLGSTRATQAGLVSPGEMKSAFIIAFSLAALAGIYLIYRGGVPILVLGILSLLSGILYTGGRYPLGYHGLGDLFVLFFFGFVAVGGTYYVQAIEINLEVIIAGSAPGFFSAGILTVNNMRDIQSDKKTGKRTLAVIMGIEFARLEYLFCMIVPCIVPVVLYLLTGAHIYSIISAIVIFPSLSTIRAVFIEEPGPVYNKVLGDTGRILLIYSLIFSAGWVL